MTSPLFEAWMTRDAASKPVLTWADNEGVLLLLGFTGVDDPRLADMPAPQDVWTLEDVAALSREPMSAQEKETFEVNAKASSAAWDLFVAEPRSPGVALMDIIPRSLWNLMSPVSRRWLENAANQGFPHA
jgi:hypothetical protein